MKKLKIKIDIYDWSILFLEIEKKSDSKKLGKELKKFHIQKEDYKYTLNNIKERVLDGGEHFYNFRLRKSMILIYKTSSKEERMVLLQLLINCGYGWHRHMGDNKEANVETIEQKYPWSAYSRVILDLENKSLAGGYSGSDYNWPEDANTIFDEVFNFKYPIVVEGLGEYSASIKKDGIHVGCQLITFEKFAELEKAVNKFNS